MCPCGDQNQDWIVSGETKKSLFKKYIYILLKTEARKVIKSLFSSRELRLRSCCPFIHELKHINIIPVTLCPRSLYEHINKLFTGVISSCFSSFIISFIKQYKKYTFHLLEYNSKKTPIDGTILHSDNLSEGNIVLLYCNESYSPNIHFIHYYILYFIMCSLFFFKGEGCK